MSYEAGIPGVTGPTGATGATGVTGMGYASGLATCASGFTNYWIPIGVTLAGYSATTTAVQALLQVPDGNTQNWIVYSDPIIGYDGAQYINVGFSTNVANSETTVSWNVVSLNNVIGAAATTDPTIEPVPPA